MYKHKNIFFLTILLFVFICTMLIPASASAQGSFFDALCGAIVDNVNELVIQEEVDQETKQIQKSAVKVFLRGDESDWDEFVDSTKEWAETSLETESNKTTKPTTYRKEQKKFVKEVSKIKKYTGKTYYFEGKIGNIDFSMKVPPYEYKTDSPTEGYGSAYADREAKIIGIYPLNAISKNKIKAFFNKILGGTIRDRQYLVILEVYAAKGKDYHMCNYDYGWAFGSVALIINEKTKYINFSRDAINLPGWGGWDIPKSKLKWNIPDVFIYDLDYDGLPEITLLREFRGPYYALLVYSTKNIFASPLELGIGSFNLNGEYNYRNIYFDGDNLYVDGKNILELLEISSIPTKQ